VPTALRVPRRSCAGLVLALVALAAALPALPALAARPGQVPARFDRVWKAQEHGQRGLLGRRGVVGVALGENAAGQPVLKVFIEDANVTGLPDFVDGEAVEAVVTGHFRAGQLEAQAGASAPTDRWPRPVPIGVSVGHQDVTAGTLGCQVFQGSGCHVEYFILSNNHVLANANAGHVDDLILQPGKYDGGVAPDDAIGKLYDFEPVEISTDASNVMDAAIAFTNPGQVDYMTPPDGYGAPRYATITPTVNMKVRKYGRTTRLTTGRVSAINATVLVDYPAGTAQFVQQFIVTGDNGQPFSGAGDSGSLVVVNGGANDKKTVGLLFAGSGTISAINPIGPILTRFNVEISGD
jgi:hypothetical protein